MEGIGQWGRGVNPLALSPQYVTPPPDIRGQVKIKAHFQFTALWALYTERLEECAHIQEVELAITSKVSD